MRSIQDGKVEVKAFGSVSAPFETAHKRYRALQDRCAEEDTAF
jgi:hypothetical protein